MKKVKISINTLTLLVTSILIYSCNKEDASDVNSDPVTDTNSVDITSVVQAKYKSAVTFSTEGSSITLQSNGTPRSCIAILGCWKSSL